MKVLESEMHRVRFAVRRRARGWLLAVGGGSALAMVVAAGIGALDLGRVGPRLDAVIARAENADLRDALAGPPGLLEAYLARRGHHLSRLLPAAFPPPSAPLPALPPAWADVAAGADAQLVAEILRDATRDASAWGPRDPVVGAGLRRLTQRVPDDGEVRAAMATWSPRLAPLPDRTGQTLDALLEARVVAKEGDACCALYDAPEGDHVIDAAIADVRRYDTLRAAAVDAARSLRDAETLGERTRVERDRAERDRALVGVVVRWTAVELALGLLGAAGVGAAVAWLRARPVVVALDAHGLTVGAHRVAWDEADDVAWREDRVAWTTARGEVRVRGLSLAADEVAALQRVTTSLRTARFAAGEDAGRAALRALVDRAQG